jgi:hypothetical protein
MQGFLFRAATDDHLPGLPDKVEDFSWQPWQVVRADLAKKADRLLRIELHHLGEREHSRLPDLRICIPQQLIDRQVDLIFKLDVGREVLAENDVRVRADKFISVRGILANVIVGALRKIEFDLATEYFEEFVLRLFRQFADLHLDCNDDAALSMPGSVIDRFFRQIDLIVLLFDDRLFDPYLIIDQLHLVGWDAAITDH